MYPCISQFRDLQLSINLYEYIFFSFLLWVWMLAGRANSRVTKQFCFCLAVSLNNQLRLVCYKRLFSTWSSSRDKMGPSRKRCTQKKYNFKCKKWKHIRTTCFIRKLNSNNWYVGLSFIWAWLIDHRTHYNVSSPHGITKYGIHASRSVIERRCAV